MKAQVAIEGFVMIGIALVIFALFSVIISERNNTYLQKENLFDAKAVANLLTTEINTAVEVGDGYAKTLILPEKLRGGISYTINLFSVGQRIQIVWDDDYYLAPINTANITGNITSGINLIKNTGGMVTIE